MKRFKPDQFKLCSLLLAVSFSFSFCTDAAQSKDPQNIVRVRYQKYCSNCHGGDGTLSINGAVKLKYSLLDQEERFLIISNGRNTMTGFAGIMDSVEIMELAVFTIKFNNAGENGN